MESTVPGEPTLPALTIEQLCGQLVVAGYGGPFPSDALVRAHRDGALGGFIVFKRNLVADAAPDEVVDALSDSLARLAEVSVTDLPPLLAIDQEGGRVARLGAPVLGLPSMRALAAKGDVDLVRRAGKALGEELRAIGLTMDFAPILDVDSNPKNPIIGDRAFATSPAEAARFALAFAAGLAEGGLLACGKHFPGHGDTEADSHLELPVVRKNRAALEATELVPFRLAARARVPAFMSAHVLYPELDEAPATLARSISHDLLRGEIAFTGVLISDDLEMRALSQDVEITSVSAVRAGCDILLVCENEALVFRARQALVAEASRDPAFRSRCEEALARGLAMRRSCPPRPASKLERDALFAAHAPLREELARPVSKELP